MGFQTLFFLFGFFPLAFISQYLTKDMKKRNIWLVIFSLFFYGWANFTHIGVLILSIVWNYLTGLWMEQSEKKESVLISGIVVDLLVLMAFKYTHFFFGIQPSSIPIGLSFFTFSEISYLVDVYETRTPASHNLLDYTVYVSYFGKISMGPIVPYHEMINQLQDRTIQWTNIGQGSIRFLKGLVKKVIFADSLALAFTSLQTTTSLFGAWLLALTYTFQIYFDFSGYSDMAIGLSEMLGFHIQPNFRHPYIASSIQDFWRRWHISLSTWFRDYLYIPLGGNRSHYIRNIWIVWFCTGFWHGANWTFIVWGLYYGALLLLEHYYLKPYLKDHPLIGHLYTFVLVMIGWVFFFSPSLSHALHLLALMFHIGQVSWIQGMDAFIFRSHWLLYVACFIFMLPYWDHIEHVCIHKVNTWWMVGFYGLSFIVCVCMMVGSTYQTFLYAAF